MKLTEYFLINKKDSNMTCTVKDDEVSELDDSGDEVSELDDLILEISLGIYSVLNSVDDEEVVLNKGKIFN